MCVWVRALLAVALSVPLPAATLRQMAIEDLILESTSIVRGRASGTVRTVQEGPLLYTLYQVDVAERWKGPAVKRIEVAVPGGESDGRRQIFSGMPQLQPGREAVLFLWQGPSGKKHVTGLTQGLFHVLRVEGRPPQVHREPVNELVIDPASGQLVESAVVEMPLAELVTRIRQTLAAGAAAP